MSLLYSCQQNEQDVRSLLYAPMPNVILDAARVSEANRAVADAFIAYEKGDYTLAEERFTSLPEELKTPDIRFYLGMAQYAQGKYADCRAKIAFGGKYGSQFGGAAMYYLVIADYESGRKVQAFERLKDLLNRNQLSDFTERGRALLEYMALDPEIPENRDR